MATSKQEQPKKSEANQAAFETHKFRPATSNRRKFTITACILAGVIIVLGGWWLYEHYHSGDNKAADAAEQASQQKNLANSINRGDNTAVVYYSTILINGKMSGKYTFSNALLAQYYMEAGSAYCNLKEYGKAITDFKDAPKYDSTIQIAALEGEASAGYAAGERQQLVPLLEQLETWAAKIHDPMAPTAAQYQKDIVDIQHNQPAENL